jgi:hypothetical protein
MEKSGNPPLGLRQGEKKNGIKKPPRTVFGRFKNLFGSAALAGTLALSGCTFDIHGIKMETRDAAADVQIPQKDANGGKDVTTIADAGSDTQQDALQDSAPDAKPWWNTDWQYCRQISITGSFPADYSHGIVLNTANFDSTHAKSDLTDLRFIQGTCETPDAVTGTLSAWAEIVNTTGDSKVWFMTKTADVPSVAMYFGNQSASSTFDISKAFLFGDDFESGSIDPSRWINVGGTNTVSGGYLKVQPPASENYFRGGLQGIFSGTDYIIETKMRNVGGINPAIMFRGSGNDWETAYVLMMNDSKEWQFGKKNGATGWGLIGSPGGSNLDNTWYDVKVGANGSTLKAYVGDMSVPVITMTDTSYSSGQVGCSDWGLSSSEADFDNFRVRTFADTEPTYSFGNEEKKQ